VEPLGTSAAMARIAAFAWAAGALFALVSVLLPDTAVNDEPLLALVAGVAAVAAVVLFVVFDRVPSWGFQVMVAAGTAVASVAAYAWGSVSAYQPLPYMWITLFAFYFFTLRTALLHLALIGAGYAIALAAESPPGDPLDGWLATVGTLLLSGMFVMLVRGRMIALVARLGDAAHRDALTELLNRRGFDEILDVELERARRSDTPLSLLLGDLDHFKRLNDELGHAAGDAELRRVARTLRVAKRRFDVAARVGGEEFALLAPDTDEQGASSLAERMRTEVDLGGAHGQRTLTISFGVATFPLHGESADDLLRAADQALYTAKRLGRNRSVVSGSDVSTERTRAQSP
jgi:diguanylate cyclase (GGDEF)-like protein